MPKSELTVWGQGCEAAAQTSITFEVYPEKSYEAYNKVTTTIKQPSLTKTYLTAEGSFKRSFVTAFFERVLAVMDGPSGGSTRRTGAGSVFVSIYQENILIEKRAAGTHTARRAAEVILSLLTEMGLLLNEDLYPLAIQPKELRAADPEDTTEID
jgi:hypothetical protein